MSLTSQLLEKVTALTSRLNDIETNSKTTEELEPLDNITLNLLLRLSQDGVSKKAEIREILALVNSNIKIIRKYIGINFNDNQNTPISQLASTVNNYNEWVVNGGLIFFYAVKNTTTLTQDPNAYNPEFHTWVFMPGNGTYGINNTQVNTSDFYYLGKNISRQEQISYDLGEIGTVPIEDFVNGGDPGYQTDAGNASTTFNALRNGIAYRYLYLGNQYLLGDSYNPTFAEDFADISNIQPSAPDLQEYISVEDFNRSMFSSHEYINLETFTDLDLSLETLDYYIIETDDDSWFYFAVKDTLAASFVGAKLYFRDAPLYKFDLGQPDHLQDGYSIWSLGDFSNTFGNSFNNYFNVWKEGGGGGSIAFDSPFIVNVNQGSYSEGDTVEAGDNVLDVVKNMLTQTKYPTFQNPSFSLSDNANNLYKVGSVINFDLTFNFNRGKILGDLVGGVWNASAEQNKRAGAATNYNIEGNNLGATNTLEVIDHKVVLGQNEFSGKVSYAQGPQPKNSAQQNYGTSLAAGDSPTRTTSFEGVYPVFANTGDIAVISEQGLLSHSVNNFVKTLPSETAVNKHTFEIPKVWLDNNAITAIYFYSNLIGDFDTNTNLLSSFSQTQFTKSVDGNDVEYIRFENTSAEKGQTQYKLIF